MKGQYYKIVVRTPSEFKTDDYKQDEIEEGRVVRLARRRLSGIWDTQVWMISRRDAHIENGKLVPDTEYAKLVVKSLASEPKWVRTNIFRARDRFKIP